MILGGGPTGICTLLCVMLKQPKRIILCEVDPVRIAFVKEHYPQDVYKRQRLPMMQKIFLKKRKDSGIWCGMIL